MADEQLISFDSPSHESASNEAPLEISAEASGGSDSMLVNFNPEGSTLAAADPSLLELSGVPPGGDSFLSAPGDSLLNQLQDPVFEPSPASDPALDASHDFFAGEGANELQQEEAPEQEQRFAVEENDNADINANNAPASAPENLGDLSGGEGPNMLDFSSPAPDSDPTPIPSLTPAQPTSLPSIAIPAPAPGDTPSSPASGISAPASSHSLDSAESANSLTLTQIAALNASASSNDANLSLTQAMIENSGLSLTPSSIASASPNLNHRAIAGTPSHGDAGTGAGTDEAETHAAPGTVHSHVHAAASQGVSSPGPSGETCSVCGLKVYVLERVVAQKRLYHKNCFKCEKCKRTLSMADFAVADGHTYCKPHYVELFKQRGRYEFDPESQPTPSATANAPATEEEVGAEGPKLSDIKSRFEQLRAGDKDKDQTGAGRITVTGGQSLESRRSALLAGQSQKTEAASSTPKRPADMPPRVKAQVGVAENQPSALPPDVVRSEAGASSLRQDELPTTNLASQMAARFKELEASTKGQPQTKPVSPGSQAAAKKQSSSQQPRNWPPSQGAGSNGHADASGSSPASEDAGVNVVRGGGSARIDSEMPSEGSARSALSMFQQRETDSKSGGQNAQPRQFKHTVDDPKARAKARTSLISQQENGSRPISEQDASAGGAGQTPSVSAEERPQAGTARALAAKWGSSETK